MGGSEIFFWWMVVMSGNGIPAVLPVPYQTQDMCEWAATEANASTYRCIPQPAADAAEYAATMAAVKPDVCEMEVK